MTPEPYLTLDQPALYQITVQGKLPDNWNNFFGEMTSLTQKGEDGRLTTILLGKVSDQSGLHGLINYIRDLGLPLLEVKIVSESSPDKKGDKIAHSKSLGSLFNLVLKAVALAVSNAALVTEILKTAPVETLISLLTIGLSALAFSSFLNTAKRVK